MGVDERLASRQWSSQRRVVSRDALPERTGHRFGHPTARDCSEDLAVLKKQASVVGAAEAVCLFEDRIEDWGEIAGRGVDDLQHLGSSGLLLQRFAGLSQEPRVLHRNYRLRPKILQQRDLLVSKGTDLPAVERHI